jgi:hypothetical protein
VRRRGGGEVPVSFFSFQDVLLSLIGISIVISMVLILQVTQVTAGALESARDMVEAKVPIEAEERALRDRVSALEQAVKAAQERPDTDPLAARTSLRQELLARSGELGQLEARAQELEEQLRDILVRNPQASSLRELLELTRRRDELLVQLEGVEQRKQVTFILDEAEPLRPIVFEISGARIVVSDVGSGASMRIAAGTAAAQCMQALRLYTALAQEEPSYILMIVTPSGIPTYQSLVQAIESLPEDRRPRLGIDLIPEGSFVSSEFPSLRPDTPNGDAAGGVR